MIDLTEIQEKLNKIIKNMDNTQSDSAFKYGNIESLIKQGKSKVEQGDYQEAMKELTGALEELNDYAIKLMQNTSNKTVKNRYLKEDK